MNKYKIIQIVCWLIVFVVFLGLAIWFLIGNRFRFMNSYGLELLMGPYEEQGRYTVEVTDVDGLDIHWTAGEMKLIPYESDEILLVEYAQRELKEDEKLTYSTSDGSFTVSYCELTKNMRNNMPSKKLEVFLPKKLAAGLRDVKLDCVSADVDVKELQVDKLYVKTVSGEVYLTDISADEGECHSTSGDMRLENLRIPELSIKTVSGEIRADDLKAAYVTARTTSGSTRLNATISEDLEYETISGDFNFQGSLKKISASSTSGAMNISTKAAPAAFGIKTVSGYVRLTMPAFDDFVLYKKTVSGSFDCEIPVMVQKESDTPYRIMTTSGDIEILKAE